MKRPTAKITFKRVFISMACRDTARRFCEERGFLFLPIEKEAIREIIDTHLPVIIRKIIKTGTLPISSTAYRSIGRISISHCDLSPMVSILEIFPEALGKTVFGEAMIQALEHHYLNEIERAIRRRLGDGGDAPEQPSLL